MSRLAYMWRLGRATRPTVKLSVFSGDELSFSLSLLSLSVRHPRPLGFSQVGFLLTLEHLLIDYLIEWRKQK